MNELPRARRLGVALSLAVGLAAIVAHAPPPPRSADAEPQAFSAGRAEQVLVRLLGDARPHPVGTPANHAVRDRLLAELRGLGLTPEIQRGVGCAWGRCAPVDNVLARIPGRRDGPAVALSAHYDSVPASPGVADDLAGVAAIVEVARALLLEAPLESPILLLITDGEEAGMLGARAFGDHRWTNDVAFVVNLEARGTSGPSHLFQTGPANAWTIAHYADRAPDPSTSSLHQTIYEALPNETDLSVHLQHQREGANLGFVGGVARYHTPRDDLDHLDRGSLQHQGDHALALARAVGDANLATLRPGRGVYMDVMHTFVLGTGPGAAAVLAVSALVALLLGWIVLLRLGQVPALGPLLGLGAWLLVLVVALPLGLGLELLVDALAGHPAPWWATRLPLAAMLWAATLAVASAVGTWLVPRAGRWGLWLGAWLAWAALAVAAALTAPGASHLLVLPTLAAGATLTLVLFLSRGTRPWAGAAPWTLLPLAAALLTWLPILLALDEAVGLVRSPVATLPAALLAGAALPLLATRDATRPWRLALGAGGLAAAALVAAALVPTATEDDPQGINLATVVLADEGRAWVAVEQRPVDLDGAPAPLPSALAEALSEPPEALRRWGFAPSAAVAVEAPSDVPVPELEPQPDGRVRLRSPRGAPVLRLELPPGRYVQRVQWPDRKAAFASRRELPGRRNLYTFLGVPPEGVVVSLIDDGVGPAALADTSFELAPAAEALAAKRPPTAVPFQRGDTLTVVTGAALPPP